jgi:predicted SnoaL-like aldol condensation-catalyzing enzyme
MVRAIAVGQSRQLGKEGAMPVEDNKQAVRRFYQDVFNARSLDPVDELLTPDGVDHTFGSQNPEQAKQFFGMVHQAFPDLHAEIHDVIAEGELVAARSPTPAPTRASSSAFLGRAPAVRRRRRSLAVVQSRPARHA